MGNSGDSIKIKKLLQELRYTVAVTSKNCVQRLNLMCKSDAFVNAYVKTHVLTEMLDLDIGETLEQYFEM